MIPIIGNTVQICLPAGYGARFSQLKDSYGEEKVVFDETTLKFSISAVKSMIAVSSDGQETWTYFEYKVIKGLLWLTMGKELIKI